MEVEEHSDSSYFHSTGTGYAYGMGHNAILDHTVGITVAARDGTHG